MEFVQVPAGNAIPRDFYLGAYEVTQQEWQAVMGNNPSSHSAAGGNAKKVAGIPPEDLKRFPVERVNWQDTQDFLARLTAKAPVSGWRYRLPTETEWKYACREGEPRQEKILFAYYFKDGITGELTIQKANFGDPVLPGRKKMPGALGRPCKVGSYEPNRLGLYDMHGNVWEWSLDLQGNFKNTRLRLGGAYTSEAHECAAGQSYGYDVENLSADQGFRVALFPVQ
jgi:formylglycine-generating enzyme required for sulfatase activity